MEIDSALPVRRGGLREIGKTKYSRNKLRFAP